MERPRAINFQKASEKAGGVWGTDSGRDIFGVEEKTGEGFSLIEAVTRNSLFHVYCSPSLTETVSYPSAGVTSTPYRHCYLCSLHLNLTFANLSFPATLKTSDYDTYVSIGDAPGEIVRYSYYGKEIGLTVIWSIFV